ncbi:MAG: 4-alpha-glucanotransferase, partial [Acidocella sp.]|nr:4-alpha-glucanotransferase [Acidocella sp.]
MDALHGLARAAGIEIEWRDVYGEVHVVADDSLRAVLAALGFSVGTEAEIAVSLDVLAQETAEKLPPLITATCGAPIALTGLRGPQGAFCVTLESGAVITGEVFADHIADSSQSFLPAIEAPGYHRLEIGDQCTTIAVAPHRALSIADVAGGEKLWGLTVQLYALRRAHDGGIGDFAALA